MNGSRLGLCLILLYALLSGRCVYSSIGDVAPRSPTTGSKLDLIVTVYARGGGKNSAGWVPVEIASRDRMQVLFTDADGDSMVDALQRLPYEVVQHFGVGRHPGVNYRYFSSLGEFQKADLSNALEVRLVAASEEHLELVGLSCLTLFIIPGFSDTHYQTEVIHYDGRGVPTMIPTSPAPVERQYIGWVFFLWGPIASDASSDFPIAVVETKVNEALPVIRGRTF